MISKKSHLIISNILISIALVFIFTVSTIQSNENRKAIETGSKNILSNKKIGWGIKRDKNHNQPDLGTENKNIIEKFDGICMGNKDKKYIYLTFDNGYEAGYTEKILDVLKNNQVSAAFFLTGHYINTQPDLVKRMIDEGHTIGNHTVNHKVLPEMNNETIKKEVMDLHTSVYEKFGYEMKYVRPPKGEYSERTIAYTNSLRI